LNSTDYTFSLTAEGGDTRLVATSVVDVAREELFAWHEREGAFERLGPPWESVDVIERSGGIRNGGRAVIGTKIGPFTQRWVAEHCDYQEGTQFRDVQVEGPFTRWEHTHKTQDGAAPGTARLTDDVVFRAPLAPLSNFAVHGRLETMFRYRHAVTRADLARHKLWGAGAIGRKRILVTGASGVIGRTLCALFTGGGHDVVRLVRRAPTGPSELQWDPTVPTVDARDLEGFDAVVHLAGENIAGKGWTESRKAELRRSRVATSQLLAESLAKTAKPPALFLCASGTGIYGDTAATETDESGGRGQGFLAELAGAWEDAAEPAVRAGIRVVHARISAVLTPRGGMLQTVLPTFKAGFGGPIAGGSQYVAWISIDDVCYALYRMLADYTLSGAINLTAPEPVTQRAFASALGARLSRPAWLPVPGGVVTALFGEIANETVLQSSRVVPRALLTAGHEFEHPNIAAALAHVLPD
jgi:uncharacterized protein